MKKVELAMGEIPDDLPDAVFNQRRGRSISMVTRVPVSAAAGPRASIPPISDDIIETDFQPRARSVTFATFNDKPQTVSVDHENMRRRSSNSLSNLSRPHLFTTFKRVVVLAVDATDNSKWAFNWYMDQIYRPDDLVVITHCPEYVGTSIFSIKTKFFTPAHTWETNLVDANKRMQALEREYESICVLKKLKYHLRFEANESVGQGIIKVADEEEADMIVIGAREMGTLKKTLIGSVSSYVLRNSKVPVVVVPASSCRDPSLVTH